MIRTAILAGILLVMLSMAYTRPSALPSLRSVAEPALSEQPAVEEAAREPVAPVAPRAEIPREQPARVAAAEKEEPAEVAAVEEPEVAEVAEVAPEPVAPVAPAREVPPPVKPEPGRPISLLPETQTAAPVRDPSRLAPLVSDNMPAPPAPVLPPVQTAKVEPVPAAELPEVYVPTRPVMVPQDFASRLMPDSVAAVEPAAPPAAPQVAEARAPVVAAGTKFMTPEERSRELYRLAREMEDTFIQKLTQ